MTAKIETIVYIDGYNLYYGRLRNTYNHVNYKWLDLYKLFQSILKAQDPNSEIVKIKYFTAPALGKFASHGNQSSDAQDAYHRALNHLYPDLLEIIMGKHVFAGKPLPAYHPDNPKQPFDKAQRHWVWILEEKMTDVQIALAMYKDVIKGQCSQVVLCSNDSDLQPALQAIRDEKPDFKIGVVMPVSPAKKGQESRRISGSLDDLASWTRHYILDDELQNALLPDKIPTRKKPILKPVHW